MKKRNYKRWRVIFSWAAVLVALLSTISCVVPAMRYLPLSADGVWRVLSPVIAAVVAFAVRLLALVTGQAFWTLEGLPLMAHLSAAAPIATWVNIVFWALLLLSLVFRMLHSASQSDGGFFGASYFFLIAALVVSLASTIGCVVPMMDYLKLEGPMGFIAALCVAAAIRFLSLLLGQAFWLLDGIPIVAYLCEARPVNGFLNVIFYLCALLFLYFAVKNLMYNAMPHEKASSVYSGGSYSQYTHSYGGASGVSTSSSSGDDPMFGGYTREENGELDDLQAAMSAEYGEDWGRDL